MWNLFVDSTKTFVQLIKYLLYNMSLQVNFWIIDQFLWCSDRSRTDVWKHRVLQIFVAMVTGEGSPVKWLHIYEKWLHIGCLSMSSPLMFSLYTWIMSRMPDFSSEFILFSSALCCARSCWFDVPAIALLALSITLFLLGCIDFETDLWDFGIRMYVSGRPPVL